MKMEIVLSDFDLNWESSDEGQLSLQRQSELIEYLLSYTFHIDLPNDANEYQIYDEVIYQLQKLTGLTVRSVDYEIFD